ncbi:hypothetical protein NL676_037526 [Syzygium grande]|nr:hypothetical protein NL676_037526 [Syzygium grande]
MKFDGESRTGSESHLSPTGQRWHVVTMETDEVQQRKPARCDGSIVQEDSGERATVIECDRVIATLRKDCQKQRCDGEGGLNTISVQIGSHGPEAHETVGRQDSASRRRFGISPAEARSNEAAFA